jgi:hypothetical protein
LATLIRMAVRCPRDLAGTRDRALLLLAANGLSRAALVGLDVEHIRFTTTAVELWLGANVGRGARRTAGEGRGVPVVVRPSADRAVCPVQALRALRRTAKSVRCFRKSIVGTLSITDSARRCIHDRRVAPRHRQSKALERTADELPASAVTREVATQGGGAADVLLVWLRTQ